MPHQIFISYSSINSAEAQTVCSALEDAHLACWIAPRNITAGSSWSDAIMEALDACQVVVLLLSSASNVSLQVHNEVNAATNLKKAILPVRLEEVPLSRHMAYYLGRLHWLSALPAPLTPHLSALKQAVQALLTPGEATFMPPVSEAAHNLFRQVSRFIGREKERAQIQEALASFALVTLLGPGGIGKTRLALQVAEEVLERYREGVWLVELAALTDPALLPQTVATGLGLREQPGHSLLQTLQEYLTSRHLLLILDNCEHLLPACARLADTLLKACPHLTILATSREGLNIAGERLYRVPSLSLPDLKTPTLEGLEGSEAIALFLERARLVQPDFQLTSENATALAQLCHHLDGIALALELAAARMRSLSVHEICSRLDHRFRLLTGGSRTALPRQQTLRALMDWSYELLNDQEKRLLSRLSVFAGGWSLHAAEAIGSGGDIEDWEVLDLLTSLADKSLVAAAVEGERTRYRLLETVREYAGDRLEELGEGERVRERHQTYFLAFAEEAEPNLTGREQADWLERLEREHDNLRAALQGNDAGSALRIAGALWGFWEVRGYFSEGREWLAGVLARDDNQSRSFGRAKALLGAGVLARHQGSYSEAQSLLKESLAIYQDLGDKQGIAESLNNLGAVAYALGDYSVAKAYFEESMTLRREIGDKQGIAGSFNNLGAVAYALPDYSAAKAYYEQSLTLRREIGDIPGIAGSLNNLALIAYDQGDYSAANTYFEESLTLQREIGDKRGISLSLMNLGAVAYALGDCSAAKAYHEESLMIQREIGDKKGISGSLYNLGEVANNEGDYSAANTYFEESLRLRREIGDKQGIAGSLMHLGAVAYALGDYSAAKAYFEASLMIQREIGDKKGIAGSLNNLGEVAKSEGDYSKARALYEESLLIFSELGNNPAIANLLEEFAVLAAVKEPSKRTPRLSGAAEVLREKANVPPDGNETARIVSIRERVRAALNEEVFVAAWSEGRAMSAEQAIEYALDAAQT